MKPSAQRRLSTPYCIGCGICRASCPKECIVMRRDADGVARPSVDAASCVGCGVCAEVCPQSRQVVENLSKDVSSMSDPRDFGVEGAQAFLAWNPDGAARLGSASGGVVTALALKLLESGRIAGIIHAERVLARRGEPHFRACLSMTAAEVRSRGGSAYEPIDFSDVLLKLKSEKTYLLTGTPCVIRGVRRLAERRFREAGPRFVTCALVCSHNATPQLLDYVADRNGVPRDAAFFVNPRNKDGIPNAGEYNTHYYNASGDLVRANRNACGWTSVWRSYAFTPTACCHCPDFWGAEADLSVKDAWGRREWIADPLGKSIVAVRNTEIGSALALCGLTMEPLASDELVAMQPPETKFKLVEADNKIVHVACHPANVRNGLFTRLTISRASRFAYRNFGCGFTALTLKLLSAVLPVPRRKKKGGGKMIKARMILVAGGYGNGNAGDEAQCAETLRILAARYPGYQVRNLTPRPDYSFDGHPGFAHDFAPRVMFFNHGRSHDWYKLTGPIRKIGFLFTSMLLYVNAWFVKRDWPVWFLNARKTAMLQELSQASLFFFCGGGYLTGATKSRLWEGALICRLCRMFGVPVVMSGQTVGEWQGRLDRRLARWGFKSVKAITLRDNESSIRDLAEIGIEGPHVFPTHDDALFCTKSDSRQLPEGVYAAVNFHFWGMKGGARDEVLSRIREILATVRSARPGLRLVFIPMHASDMKSFEAYRAAYPDEALTAFKYDYDFRKVRRVIADAKFVLTMKHHPIIFAVGEDTPVVSLAYSGYYVHKNYGALEQYGVEACSMDLAADDWRGQFEKAFAKASDRDWFVRTVRVKKAEVAARKEKFMKIVDGILGKVAGR